MEHFVSLDPSALPTDAATVADAPALCVLGGIARIFLCEGPRFWQKFPPRPSGFTAQDEA